MIATSDLRRTRRQAALACVICDDTRLLCSNPGRPLACRSVRRGAEPAQRRAWLAPLARSYSTGLQTMTLPSELTKLPSWRSVMRSPPPGPSQVVAQVSAGHLAGLVLVAELTRMAPAGNTTLWTFT